jgi:hypothetical protein
MAQKLSASEKDDINRLVAEYREETDRATVILSAAKLDHQLYQILTKALRASPTGKDELLDGDRALAPFSARIHMAYRLGILSPEFAWALHLIRKIRNSFAHEPSGVSLASGPHADQVRTLVSPMVDNWAYQQVLKRFGDEAEGPQAQYRAAVTLLMMRLMGALKRTSPCDAFEQYELLPHDKSGLGTASLDDSD